LNRGAENICAGATAEIENLLTGLERGEVEAATDSREGC
jgi:hypothetical protein